MNYGIWQIISDFMVTLYLKANAVINVFTDSTTPGSLEWRIGALGNGTGAPKPYWRILFNATGGIEIQNAGQANYSDAKNVLSLGAFGEVNVNIDNNGLNLDSSNTGIYSNINFRDSNGVIKGQVACGPSPLNANQPAVFLSAVNLSGALQPYLLIDPRDSTQADAGDNPICMWASGGWHRLRRASNGTATLS